MSAAYGMLLLALSVFLVLVARRAVARPRPPWWASDGIVGNVICPSVVALVSIGGAMLIRFFVAEFSGVAEWRDWLPLAAAVVLVAAASIAWRRMAGTPAAPAAEILPFPPATNTAGPEPTGPHHRDAA